MLKDESGANAVDYALIMALAAVFIIGGLLTLSSAIREPLTDTAACLADPANCANNVLASGINEQGGESGNSLSGLADATNPGAGGGSANSPNPGLNNPGGKGAGKGNAKGGGKGNAKGGGKRNAKGGGKGLAQGGGQGLARGGGQGLGQGGGQGGG